MTKKIHFFDDTEAHKDKHLHLQSVIMALLCITVCNDALFTHSLCIA